MKPLGKKLIQRPRDERMAEALVIPRLRLSLCLTSLISARFILLTECCEGLHSLLQCRLVRIADTYAHRKVSLSLIAVIGPYIIHRLVASRIVKQRYEVLIRFQLPCSHGFFRNTELRNAYGYSDVAAQTVHQTTQVTDFEAAALCGEKIAADALSKRDRRFCEGACDQCFGASDKGPWHQVFVAREIVFLGFIISIKSIMKTIEIL